MALRGPTLLRGHRRIATDQPIEGQIGEATLLARALEADVHDASS
jgi:hypothetical protein